MEKTVLIKPLKDFAEGDLSSCPLTREAILSERDALTVEEFLAKCRLWLRLLKKETR